VCRKSSSTSNVSSQLSKISYYTSVFTRVRNLQVQNQEVQCVERSRDSVASAFSAQYPTHGVPPSKNGLRHDIPLVLQLGNGGLLIVSLQVKFYKTEDNNRSSWGSSLHCIEYECSYTPGTPRVIVTKETYRLC